MHFDDSQREADALRYWRIAMRVPIYPNDLQPRGSFKRLAEVLKKNGQAISQSSKHWSTKFCPKGWGISVTTKSEVHPSPAILKRLPLRPKYARA